jgi:hypothetical protein
MDRNRDRLLVSAQRALLEKITPNLRSVHIILNDYIELIFSYDKPPSEEEEVLASITFAEFVSDFHSLECKARFNRKVIPYPKKISSSTGNLWVFRRYEESLSIFDRMFRILAIFWSRNQF